MSVTFIIFLAIVWGIFGLWGFLRGWKAALVMLVLIIGSLLLLSAAPERVAALFDYVNKAAALVTGSTRTPTRPTWPIAARRWSYLTANWPTGWRRRCSACSLIRNAWRPWPRLLGT